MSAGAKLNPFRLLVARLRQPGLASPRTAAGAPSATGPVNGNDESGRLAADFNDMVEQLRESERVLEQRVEDRTRELGTLLEVSRSVASNIELDPLLDSVLEQVHTVAEYDRGSVQVFEDGMFTVRAMRDFGDGRGYQTQLRPGMRFPPLTGPVSQQFEEHEPIIINDIKGDSQLAAVYRDILHPDVNVDAIPGGSFMAVPLIAQGTVVGRISIGRDVTGFYTAEHARLARAIASQVAIAIQNARLYEASQRRARETEALLRADSELFRSLDLDSVLQALVDVAVDVLGADKSAVALHQGEIDIVRASRSYSRENIALFNSVIANIPHVEPPPETQTAKVYIDATQAPGVLRDALAREGIVSHISVPVRDARRMLGVFSVSFVTEHLFTASEERLYGALADRAAVAIQNAELFEKAQHAASLEERQRLARELHDSVSQALYGIALGARTARLRLDEDPASAVEPIDYVTSLAEAGLAEMRALIFELRPESLETEGLVAAIEKQIASIRARHQVSIAAALGEEPACPIEVKEALYRIAQEALHNVVKHAHASRVDVRLERAGDVLILTVADDGRGFDANQSFPGHVGLQSMPERAAKLGGTVTVESGAGDGTRVVAQLPLDRPPARP